MKSIGEKRDKIQQAGENSISKHITHSTGNAQFYTRQMFSKHTNNSTNGNKRATACSYTRTEVKKKANKKRSCIFKSGHKTTTSTKENKISDKKMNTFWYVSPFACDLISKKMAKKLTISLKWNHVIAHSMAKFSFSLTFLNCRIQSSKLALCIRCYVRISALL